MLLLHTFAIYSFKYFRQLYGGRNSPMACITPFSSKPIGNGQRSASLHRIAKLAWELDLKRSAFIKFKVGKIFSFIVHLNHAGRIAVAVWVRPINIVVFRVDLYVWLEFGEAFILRTSDQLVADLRVDRVRSRFSESLVHGSGPEIPTLIFSATVTFTAR